MKGLKRKLEKLEEKAGISQELIVYIMRDFRDYAHEDMFQSPEEQQAYAHWRAEQTEAECRANDESYCLYRFNATDVRAHINEFRITRSLLGSGTPPPSTETTCERP